MDKQWNNKTPDYVFEVSWEVCNRIGGIYTVLSTHAKTLMQRVNNHLIFIGPDLGEAISPDLFAEDRRVFRTWQKEARDSGLKIRVGKWLIPGEPVAILVDFKAYMAYKNDIYAAAWNDFKVDSLHAYGDYDDSSMFAYAAAKVMEHFYHYYRLLDKSVVFHAHEWQTGMGALYIRKYLPMVGTVFTTHATSIGRSIAGNNKPLYAYLSAYNGDQMAQELNMVAKHSIEKQTAHHVDCFTTVSEITNKECSELLDKPADVVLVNGFENDFVPKGRSFTLKRQKARRKMLQVVNALNGTDWGDDTLIVATSGRYEFKNKGIDVFIESVNRLSQESATQRNIAAFINVPGWVASPRAELQERLQGVIPTEGEMECSFLTHWLHNQSCDSASNMIQYLNVNGQSSKVKVIFVPCYLHGNDGIFNLSYYDLLIGNDMSVYSSYYEPWGYTPLESIAFKVPTVTTDLAGFGQWAQHLKSYKGIAGGVEVIHRTDHNYNEVAEEMKKTILTFAQATPEEVQKMRKAASRTAEKALWKHFIVNYSEAYSKALQKAKERMCPEEKKN
jgi:glycosyltransferase involved in cell wall biosynthesis